MPVELEDRIRDAGRQPRAEPDLEALWRSGRTARRRQIVSRGAAGIASVAVVAAVAVTQLPGDGVELADSPDADDNEMADDVEAGVGPAAEEPSDGDSSGGTSQSEPPPPTEGFSRSVTYGEIDVEVPNLPKGLSWEGQRAVLFPDTEVVAYQSAYGEVGGPRLQTIVYVGVDGDIDAALDADPEAEPVKVRAHDGVTVDGDAPAVAWGHADDVVIAVHAVEGVSQTEVLRAARALNVNAADLDAAVASRPAQVRAYDREQQRLEESLTVEPVGEPIPVDGGSGDLEWEGELRAGTDGGLCWDIASLAGQDGGCAPGLDDDQTLEIVGAMTRETTRYDTMVGPDVAAVRYRFADGEVSEAQVVGVSPEIGMAILLRDAEDPELVLVEALDADAERLDSARPWTRAEADSDAARPWERMVLPATPLPLSQFEVWAEFQDGFGS